jgi:hypothetical protein
MEFDFDEYDPTPKIRPILKKRMIPSPEPYELPERFVFKTPGMYIPTLKPITNIENYIRSAGLEGEQAEEIRKKYTPEPDEPKEEKETINVPSDPLHVFCTTKVLKNGKVSIKLSVPMEPVYEYHRKGERGPINIRIRAAKAFGYPDSILEKMLRHEDKITSDEYQEEMDEFIEKVFGQAMNAKVSKPKKKTIHETLTAIMKKRVPVAKY